MKFVAFGAAILSLFAVASAEEEQVPFLTTEEFDS